eukprot:CAMPEP_0184718914 /NCGR_PEP_ID=MMETSP0314-20130426/7972_1 /TAXON_ID=38298 /ORGANISM="Rhodella maculata, Strain CCMP 736" /LENGTH=500 /DNA_ID=CAMNT_0027182731 /DNA_START=82 /DNA_END=1580 /DNA_ORIENTATION=-
MYRYEVFANFISFYTGLEELLSPLKASKEGNASSVTKTSPVCLSKSPFNSRLVSRKHNASGRRPCSHHALALPQSLSLSLPLSLFFALLFSALSCFFALFLFILLSSLFPSAAATTPAIFPDIFPATFPPCTAAANPPLRSIAATATTLSRSFCRFRHSAHEITPTATVVNTTIPSATIDSAFVTGSIQSPSPAHSGSPSSGAGGAEAPAEAAASETAEAAEAAARISGKIFVGGLPGGCDEAQLRDFFGGYGAVEDAQVMIDHKTGNSRGFGFVTFAASDTMDKLLGDIPQGQSIRLDLSGKSVEVKRAQPKGSMDPVPPRGPGGRGGGGGGFDPHGAPGMYNPGGHRAMPQQHSQSQPGQSSMYPSSQQQQQQQPQQQDSSQLAGAYPTLNPATMSVPQMASILATQYAAYYGGAPSAWQQYAEAAAAAYAAAASGSPAPTSAPPPAPTGAGQSSDPSGSQSQQQSVAAYYAMMQQYAQAQPGAGAGGEGGYGGMYGG